MSDLQDIFYDESSEIIIELEEDILSLEKNMRDRELINSVFRSFHTLKGSAGVAGFDEISGFSHKLENLLSEIRDGNITITKKIIDILLNGVDVIKGMIASIMDSGSYNKDLKKEVEKKVLYYVEDEDGQTDNAEETKQTEEDKEKYFMININLNENIFETGQDPLFLFEELSDISEILSVKSYFDYVGDFEKYDPYKNYTRWDVIIKTKNSLGDIKNVFIFVDDENDIEIENITEQYEDYQQMDMGTKKIGELLVDDGIVEKEDIENILDDHKKIGELLNEELGVPKEDIEKVAKKQKKARKRLKSKSVRVNTGKLDKVINIVGEVIISTSALRNMHYQDLNQKEIKMRLQSTVDNLQDKIRNLQENVIGMRMLPIESTFNRFKRMIRDMAVENNKKVDVKFYGTDTELDKNVIENIVDPLKHLIRNAIDHGIEKPDIRKQKEKNEEGLLELSAYHKEGNVYIEIQDDGRGIDKEKILQKAIENDIAEEEKKYSDEEIYNFIFKPGFSTAKEVTDISGRGVGMDVVKQNIENLNGSVTIDSELDKYTKIIIKLPLTLAIIDGMLLEVGDNKLIIPLLSIIEMIKPTKKILKTVEGRGELILSRDEYIPFIRLKDELGYNEGIEDTSDGLVLVVEGDQIRFGLFVDDIQGEQEAVIKNLKDNYKKIDGISGASVLGDGSIALILDLYTLEKRIFNNN